MLYSAGDPRHHKDRPVVSWTSWFPSSMLKKRLLPKSLTGALPGSGQRTTASWMRRFRNSAGRASKRSASWKMNGTSSPSIRWSIPARRNSMLQRLTIIPATVRRTSPSARRTARKVLVIGSGPIRIGQGIEFDFCSVHSVWALRDLGYETIHHEQQPGDRQHGLRHCGQALFEPLTPEDVLHVGAVGEARRRRWCSFGGQTAIKLAGAIEKMGIPILGTSFDSIDAAEDRERFDAILNECEIPRAAGRTVFTCAEALAAANEPGIPGPGAPVLCARRPGDAHRLQRRGCDRRHRRHQPDCTGAPDSGR